MYCTNGAVYFLLCMLQILKKKWAAIFIEGKVK